MKTLLKNANIVNEGKGFLGYVIIEDEFIAEVGKGMCPPEKEKKVDKVENLMGKWLLPGMIDEHVHFRDPGLTHKGDMESESRAAVAGGVTSFIDMPNTIPPTVSVEEVEKKKQRAKDVAWANYGFFIAATNDNLEELKNADYSGIAGVKLFMGSTTGKMAVTDPEVLDSVFKDVPALIAVHAEDDAVISENKKKLFEKRPELKESLLPEDVYYHGVIRDAKACLSATKKAVALAEKHGSRLHVMHVSTPEELELFESGDLEDKKITAEACLHYIWFGRNDFEGKGTLLKCNPAIKDNSIELEDGILDGRIDTIGSDHAPHLMKEKLGMPVLEAPSGMPGISETLRLLMMIAEDDHIAFSRIAQLTAHNPARLFGIDRRGFIRPGYYADLVVMERVPGDLIRDEDSLYKCGWTPYSDAYVKWRVAKTFVNGSQAYPFLTRPTVHPLLFHPR